MHTQAVIAIFDIGKTNKKLLLFNQQYQVVEERSIQLPQTVDEDGDPCEDLSALTRWIKESYEQVITRVDITLKAVNFSAYGASFVYLDEKGEVLAPLYNYLKTYPEGLQDRFFNTYGGAALLSRQTASPVLGSLNSGLQLYRLKYEHQGLFERIHYALHLPQYASYVLSRNAATDLTSVGCHTMLWDFEREAYHHWVEQEGLLALFTPMHSGSETTTVLHQNNRVKVGAGLHDSSAALIPYLASFSEPFVLLSTGTWCISLNPFNYIPLTPEELTNDCLCYLSYQGTPVKASRLFAGNEHELQVKRLAAHFGKDADFYKHVEWRPEFLDGHAPASLQKPLEGILFADRNLADYSSYEQAYHQLIGDIITQQVVALERVLTGAEKQLFVDGGFSRNAIYMNLLAAAFPKLEVYAASVAQASSLGAALAIHQEWNNEPLPQNLIECKRYTVYDHSLSWDT